MKIHVGAKRWATVSQKRSFERLAQRVMNHYPKDSQLHKAVSDALKSMDQAASKLKKSAVAKPKRKVAKRKAVRRTTRRRTTAKRRTTTKRRTARKSAPKRRTAKRRTTAKRTMKRRTPAKRRSMRRRAA